LRQALQDPWFTDVKKDYDDYPDSLKVSRQAGTSAKKEGKEESKVGPVVVVGGNPSDQFKNSKPGGGQGPLAATARPVQGQGQGQGPTPDQGIQKRSKSFRRRQRRKQKASRENQDGTKGT